MAKNPTQALARALSALTLISERPRADGSYSRNRQACEQLARQTLTEIDRISGEPAPDHATAEAMVAASETPVPPPRPIPGNASVPVAAVPAGAKGALSLLIGNPTVAPGKVFTVNSDGASKGNPGPAGWGVTVECAGKLVHEEGGYLEVQTNQVAELMGALEGLRRVPAGATVSLVSDSQYVVKGINEWRHGWVRKGWRTSSNEPVANKDIWVALLAEVDKRTVTASWVRGHSGNAMNERCDQLANKAVSVRGQVFSA